MGKISASGKYTPYDDDNNDGSETAVGILLNNVDATSADAPGVLIFRFAEVSSAAIVWASTNDATDKTNGIADLSAKHIVFR